MEGFCYSKRYFAAVGDQDFRKQVHFYHIRKRPNCGLSIGTREQTSKAMPTMRRVSSGAIRPSAHRLAVEYEASAWAWYCSTMGRLNSASSSSVHVWPAASY